MRKPAPEAAFAAKTAKVIPHCDGDFSPDFYRPDESTRLTLARRWITQARSESLESANLQPKDGVGSADAARETAKSRAV